MKRKIIPFLLIVQALLFSACNTSPASEEPDEYVYLADSEIVFPRLTSASIDIAWSDAGGPYTLMRGDYLDNYVDILKTSETTFTDQGLTPDTVYKYRVFTGDGKVLAEATTGTASEGQVFELNIGPKAYGVLETQATSTQNYIRDYLKTLPTWKSYANYNTNGYTEKKGAQTIKYWDTKYKQFVSSPAAARCTKDDYYNPNNFCVARYGKTPVTVGQTFKRHLAGMSRPSPTDSWLGLLIQGKSIKNNDYSYAKINVAEANRTPIQIFVTGSPTTKIVSPNPAKIETAINEIISKLKPSALPANLSYRSVEENTSRQTAYALGANFTLFNAGLGVRISGDNSDVVNSAAALLTREAFVVSFGNPLNPSDPTGIFNDKMTKATFDSLVKSGAISKTNVPTVISEIRYGQLFYVSLSSTESAKNLRTTLDFMGLKATCEDGQCSCDGDGNGGCAALNYSSIINTASKAVDSYGGDVSLIAKALQKQDFTQILSSSINPLAMQPISFTYKTIGRGETAIVSLTNTSNSYECKMMSVSYIGPRTGSNCSKSVFGAIPK